MKTHKPIRSAKELIGGQYYIRVWINDAGEAGTEVLRIAGKPFADDSGFFKGEMRINTRRKDHVGDWNDEYYISDMGAEARHPCVRAGASRSRRADRGRGGYRRGNAPPLTRGRGNRPAF